MTVRKNRAKDTILTLVILATALSLSLVACAPSQKEDGSAAKSEEATTASIDAPWSAESDCTSCHTAEAETASDSTTAHSTHATLNSGQKCIDCHDDEGGLLSAAHENYLDEKARLPKKLKDTSVADATCTASGCHNVDELVAKTSDSSMMLVDSEGATVNPHSMLTDEKHALGGETSADIQCSTCHKLHEAKSADAPAAAETAQARCKSCHHAEVYQCGTCHE